METRFVSPPPADASPSDTRSIPLSRDTHVAGASTGGDEPRVLFFAGDVACIALGGQVYSVALDVDHGAHVPGSTGACGTVVSPDWSRTDAEADEALSPHEDVLVELLTDWHVADAKARAA